MRNKKYHDKRKIQSKVLKGDSRNFADNVQSLSSLTLDHPFIQSVENVKNKIPCVILYTEDMLQQIIIACAKVKPAVVSVDRTFNLGDVFVTVMVFKQRAVIRKTTKESPIFTRPLFLHEDAKAPTYARFFTHLASKFKESGCVMKNFIFRSDDEKAMTSALKYAFPEATHVLCLRHIMGSVKDHLTNKIGLAEKNRATIMTKLLGNNGAASADDTITFDEKIKEVLTACEAIEDQQLQLLSYLDKRIVPTLKTNVLQPRWTRELEDKWTNNNTESANHILKLAVD